ncbi:hypothetical protein LCGC14_0685920 [marine sediment metagenome]|uniref:Uncharacterized protein n=1 Tax=marine sediment metagenome TaxID=412755 RepID=A0A0F9QRN9_9ZZZZ
MAYFTGKTGEVISSGNTMNVTGWTAETTSELADTSHSGSGGYRTFVWGLRGATGTLDLNWDSAVDLTSAVPAIKSGEDIGALQLFLEAGQGYILAASALVSSCTYTVAVDGVVTFSVAYTVSGTFDLTNIGTW